MLPYESSKLFSSVSVASSARARRVFALVQGSVSMAPHSIECLSREVYKHGRIIKSARLLGMMVEIYFRLCFKIGGNSVTPGSFPNTVQVKLDNLGYRDVLLNQALRTPAMNIGEAIRSELRERGYHILHCNVPVMIGVVKVGEHSSSSSSSSSSFSSSFMESIGRL